MHEGYSQSQIQTLLNIKRYYETEFKASTIDVVLFPDSLLLLWREPGKAATTDESDYKL